MYEMIVWFFEVYDLDKCSIMVSINKFLLDESSPTLSKQDLLFLTLQNELSDLIDAWGGSYPGSLVNHSIL